MTVVAGTVAAPPCIPLPVLPVLLVPFAIAATGGVVADWIWPKLVTDDTLVLITLSSKNRFLLLTAPQLGAVAFFVVGFLRLVATDPLTYVLGGQYDEDALGWIERKGGDAQGSDSWVRRAERLFNRAGPRRW